MSLEWGHRHGWCTMIWSRVIIPVVVKGWSIKPNTVDLESVHTKVTIINIFNSEFTPQFVNFSHKVKQTT